MPRLLSWSRAWDGTAPWLAAVRLARRPAGSTEQHMYCAPLRICPMRYAVWLAHAYV